VCVSPGSRKNPIGASLFAESLISMKGREVLSAMDPITELRLTDGSENAENTSIDYYV
jgi:hypothetical protein